MLADLRCGHVELDPGRGLGALDQERHLLAPLPEVDDLPAIIGAVREGHDRDGELREVTPAAHVGERRVVLEEALERHRISGLALANERSCGGVDAAVHTEVEMLGAQEIGDGLVGGVLHEDRREQRLLDLLVAGRLEFAMSAVEGHQAACSMSIPVRELRTPMAHARQSTVSTVAMR